MRLPCLLSSCVRLFSLHNIYLAFSFARLLTSRLGALSGGMPLLTAIPACDASQVHGHRGITPPASGIRRVSIRVIGGFRMLGKFFLSAFKGLGLVWGVGNLGASCLLPR